MAFLSRITNPQVSANKIAKVFWQVRSFIFKPLPLLSHRTIKYSSPFNQFWMLNLLKFVMQRDYGIPKRLKGILVLLRRCTLHVARYRLKTKASLHVKSNKAKNVSEQLEQKRAFLIALVLNENLGLGDNGVDNNAAGFNVPTMLLVLTCNL